MEYVFYLTLLLGVLLGPLFALRIPLRNNKPALVETKKDENE